jgi:signal transduction histidine kinase
VTSETADSIDLNTLVAAQFHELKNELGQLALSLDEVANEHPEVASALMASRANSRAIIDRLVQVLTLYKHHAGSLPLNVEAHAPRAFVEELVAEAASLAGGRLAISSHCEAAPPFWFFDRYLTSVALTTALHNALEFATQAIEIGARAEHGGLCFYVQDDSSGYPEHILDNQGTTPGKSARGTGLGLYFARTIARAHKNNGREGSMQLKNEGGAAFSIWLP